MSAEHVRRLAVVGGGFSFILAARNKIYTMRAVFRSIAAKNNKSRAHTYTVQMYVHANILFLAQKVFVLFYFYNKNYLEQHLAHFKVANMFLG